MAVARAINMGLNQLISTKVVIGFTLILTGFSSLSEVDNLLILGAGSDMGANHKISIFEKLRPWAQRI